MSTGTAREMMDGLRDQRRRAPESLAGRVLAEVGLVDSWTEIAGPIGPLYVAWGPDGVSAAERAGDAPGFELTYALRTGRPVQRVATLPDRLARQIRRRLAGERTDGPAVDLGSLTSFERDVLHKTMEIPFGEVRPYSWVAREIGRPRAVRAVGSSAFPQSDRLRHPVPPGRPRGRADRRVRGRWARSEAPGARRRGRRRDRAGATGGRACPLSREPDDRHLLLPVLPPCATHLTAPPRGVRVGRRRDRGGVPAVPHAAGRSRALSS